jgi:hypothetical protein
MHQAFLSPPIQSALASHDVQIATLFKFYQTGQGAALVTPGTEDRLAGVTLAAFNRFGTQFNLWPGLMTYE